MVECLRVITIVFRFTAFSWLTIVKTQDCYNNVYMTDDIASCRRN